MSTQPIGTTARDLYVLSACATGAAINRADDFEDAKAYIGGGIGIVALPYAWKTGKAAVWDIPKWGYQNYGNYGPAFQNVWNNSIGQTNLYSANRQALNGHFWETVNTNSLKTELKAINIPEYNLAEVNKLRSLVSEASQLEGKELAAKLKEIKRAETQAKIAVQEAKAAGLIQSNTTLGKATSWVKTKTGVRAAETAVLKGTLSENTVVRTLSKGAKAGGGMAVISAALEAPTVYEAYKKYGAKVGTKQLGQSAVKVVAETAGYALGAKLGGIAGAKIGATIGTAIGGPIGTAIGGVVGTIIGVGCGILGSIFGGKVARAVTGEDAVEVAKRKEAIKLANAAKNNKELQIQLVNNAAQVCESGMLGEEDTKTTVQSITRTVDRIESQQVTQTTQNTFTPDAGFNALLALTRR